MVQFSRRFDDMEHAWWNPLTPYSARCYTSVHLHNYLPSIASFLLHLPLFSPISSHSPLSAVIFPHQLPFSFIFLYLPPLASISLHIPSFTLNSFHSPSSVVIFPHSLSLSFVFLYSPPRGGEYLEFRNFWVGMCRWDSGALNLYQS